jgi:LacI family transcriptional regulator
MPLWAQLSEQLRWFIVRGDVSAGDRLPAIRRLADELGIHLHTVRAAYENLEAEGLVARRRGVGTVVLDYDRGALGDSVADLPSFTIGVVLAGYSPFYAPLLDGIEAGARDQGSMMLLANARDDARAAARYLSDFTVRGVDGVIVASVGLDPPPRARSGPPLVRVDRPGEAEPSVTFDLAGGVEEATRHLIDHGHHRLGLLAPPLDWNNGSQIRAGYAAAAGAAGHDAAIGVMEGYEMEMGAAAARRLLDGPDPPTALIAAGDIPAIGAVNAARSLGRSVPEEVAVIGTGDIEMAAAVAPPLTTIALPAREMGTRAVDMLGRLSAAGPVDPSSVELPTRLVLRRSCGCT